jgi:hypothetical protein
MRDLQNPRFMYLKGVLFLGLGVAAAALIWAEAPSWKVILLLALVVWSFCRAYYFAFYVIEHYIDPGYKFAGLTDFARYLLRRREPAPGEPR